MVKRKPAAAASQHAPHTSIYGTFAPRERIVAVLDQHADVLSAVAALRLRGIADRAIELLPARAAVSVAWALRRQPRWSPKRMLAAIVRTLCVEDEQQRAYLDAARLGGWLVVVQAHSQRTIEQTCAALRSCRAHDVAYYSTHGSIESLEC